MNIKTNFLEDLVNFVDSLRMQSYDNITTKKTYFKIIILLFVLILSLLLFFLFLEYLNDSLEQMSKTGNLNSNLILSQYKLDLSAMFIEIESVNPKIRHDEVAKDLESSSPNLQR